MSYQSLTAHLDQQGIWEMVSNPHDQVSYCGEFCIKASAIHGLGTFSKDPIRAGIVIGAARMSGFRTPLGRYTNHADDPNARMILVGEDLYLLAIKPIEKNREITLNYAQVVKVNRESPWS